MTESTFERGLRRRPRDLLDVAVVGGGMVGAAAALALARDGLRCALIEAREPVHWQMEDEVDLRVVALAPSSARLLRELGLWDRVLEARAQAYDAMHVWDAESGAQLDFDAAGEGREALGWIVENRLLQSMLWDALEQIGVRRVCPAQVQMYAVHDDHARLQLEDGATLSARLLVAADGAHSALREQAGIDVRERDYAQRAVVAHVRTEGTHGHAAWQRFTADGPVAFLPLADGRSSVVWTLPQARAGEVLELSDADFCDALGLALDFRLGRVIETSRRAAFPLRLQLARSYQAERLVLLGDAAHVVHPLAGQGVNLGLRDVIELRETLQRAQQRGADLGAAHVLRRYARRRRSANAMDARSFDALARLFARTEAPLVGVRSLGMRAINRLEPLKRAFGDHAAGR